MFRWDEICLGTLNTFRLIRFREEIGMKYIVFTLVGMVVLSIGVCMQMVSLVRRS